MAEIDTTVAVVGATPGGIAAAARTAREGIDATLVSLDEQIGGCLPTLQSFETLYDGVRSPINREIEEAILEHYRDAFGPDSEEYEIVSGKTGPNKLEFEPHVVERILDDLVEAEDRIRVLREYYPDVVERRGDLLRAVTLAPFGGGSERRIGADVFVDATYEGDLAARAGVEYRVGRESRDEFGEQHAGKLFTRYLHDDDGFPRDTAAGELDLRPWFHDSGEIFSGSTGEGDDAVQAYGYKLCMSNDPENSRPVEKPPGYDRSRYLPILQDPEETVDEEPPLHSVFLTNRIEDLLSNLFPETPTKPNGKHCFSPTNFVGQADDYPEADWEERAGIVGRHRRHALGLLYFLQHDEAVPEAVGDAAREWGLATDEFTATDNFPNRIYVREARRIDGRYVLTEDDARVAPGIDRPPVHADAVAVAGDWYMDSHSCTAGRRRGSMPDGKMSLREVTRPFHVPYRSLLPDGIENLIVPVAMSATHVAWGALRLEPTWMHVAEAAGYAAARAGHEGVPPGALDVDGLQRTLAEEGVLLSFFNDHDAATDEPWRPAVQYLATKGFFEAYDARADAPLTRSTLREWSRGANGLATGSLDATALARRVADAADDERVTGQDLRNTLAARLEDAGIDAEAVARSIEDCDVDGKEVVSRGEACRVIYALLDR